MVKSLTFEVNTMLTRWHDSTLRVRPLSLHVRKRYGRPQDVVGP
jgi:hypothetical protein